MSVTTELRKRRSSIDVNDVNIAAGNASGTDVDISTAASSKKVSGGIATTAITTTATATTGIIYGQGRTLNEKSDNTSSDEKDGCSDEDISVLRKLDKFLYTLESRLDDLEEFGLQKLGQVDESVHHAYHTLREIRNEAIGNGWKRADALMKVIEERYLNNFATTGDNGDNENGSNSNDNNDDDDDDGIIPSKLSHALRLLEEKLAHIEASCFDVVDGTLALGVQSALRAAAERLLTYDELPLQWRDNPYIIRGYRFSKTYADCIYSMVKVHNETCNIWTHLVGFFVMLGLALCHMPTTLSWRNSTIMDRITLIIFMVAAMKCLVCSAVWHTFSAISRVKMKKNFACVDYTGITVLIAASILTTEYTALYCNSLARTIYMTITAGCGIGGAIFTWAPSFDKKESRIKRIMFFVSFAVAGFLGFLHASYYHGLVDTFMFYLPVFKSLACYFCGVIIYSLLIPERWCPGGIFDYFGMSHNLWHISVFGGIYYHYIATVSLLEGARAFSCINPTATAASILSH